MMHGVEPQETTFASRVSSSVGRIIFGYLDRTTVYWKSRWTCFFVLAGSLVARVVIVEGFYVVLYAWAIYLLNLLIGFVSPKIDPETDLYVLPVRDADEYRPFQRRIPEFQFWSNSMRATCFALCLTLFSAFDLPVFWPILLIYFVLLFVMTVKQQVLHMMKYKYVPFSWGKQTYGDITRSRKVPAAAGGGGASGGTVSSSGAPAAAAAKANSHRD